MPVKKKHPRFGSVENRAARGAEKKRKTGSGTRLYRVSKPVFFVRAIW
jgi:hypothetical protein